MQTKYQLTHDEDISSAKSFMFFMFGIGMGCIAAIYIQNMEFFQSFIKRYYEPTVQLDCKYMENICNEVRHSIPVPRTIPSGLYNICVCAEMDVKYGLQD